MARTMRDRAGFPAAIPVGRWKRLACLTGCAAMLATTGCVSVGPDYQRPTVATPAAFAGSGDWQPAQPASIGSGPWWGIYGDQDLDALERQLEISSESLKASAAAYEQAQALADEARAGYWPGVTATGSEQRSRSVAGGNPVIAKSLSATLSASWVPDIWGKVRRSVEAADASAQVSGADLAAAKLSLQTALATDYFALRIDDDLARVYRETIAAYESTLQITRNQFEAGTAAETDVITAQTQLLGAQAQLTGIGVQRTQLEHAIAALLGRAPEGFSLAVKEHFAPVVPFVPPGLPSTLLERRPDIAAAERTVAASNAQIGVALSAYFPSLTLTGSLGDAASTLGSLFHAANRIWALGPQVSETVWDGGLRAAQVRAARAGYEASVANYRQTVLTAFTQVEDQLAALRILDEQAQIQKRAVDSAHEAVALTINQYEAGVVAYTSVVTVQAIALSDEQAMIANLNSRLAASVALVAAVGGGWSAQIATAAR